jgi:hypothetical protein
VHRFCLRKRGGCCDLEVRPRSPNPWWSLHFSSYFLISIPRHLYHLTPCSLHKQNIIPLVMYFQWIGCYPNPSLNSSFFRQLLQTGHGSDLVRLAWVMSFRPTNTASLNGGCCWSLWTAVQKHVLRSWLGVSNNPYYQVISIHQCVLAISLLSSVWSLPLLCPFYELTTLHLQNYVTMVQHQLISISFFSWSSLTVWMTKWSLAVWGIMFPVPVYLLCSLGTPIHLGAHSWLMILTSEAYEWVILFCISLIVY